MSQIPTVRVVAAVSDDNTLGYIVINESDFVEGVHERFEEPKTPEQAPTADDAPKPKKGS